MIAVAVGCIEMQSRFALHPLDIAIVANEIAFTINATRKDMEFVVDDTLRRRFQQRVIVVCIGRLNARRIQFATLAILEHVDLAIRASHFGVNAHNVIVFRVLWIEPHPRWTHTQHRS